ncbi:hypothetical protein EYF80_007412 [Liparis tanakae]|uniref:Uncharacterized protein n=1 Tax=Liparis tanakae TaxID=230148 RepID=A0A4Z2IX03_9TELE|nr:hypothetical protein EYF80_007412 [Liparis tanakae]
MAQLSDGPHTGLPRLCFTYRPDGTGRYPPPRQGKERTLHKHSILQNMPTAPHAAPSFWRRRRQAAERSESVSENRSKVHSDHTRPDSAHEGTHTYGAPRTEGTYREGAALHGA